MHSVSSGRSDWQRQERIRSCRHCGLPLFGGRSNRVFCSDAHRVAHHRQEEQQQKEQRKAERLAEKLEKLAATSYGRWLATQAKRSGTVQVFEGHTAETLRQLAALRQQCTRYGGYEGGKPLNTYEISHIVPCGPRHEHLGLLHPQNLVIAPKAYNRQRSSKAPEITGFGLSIPRSSLQRKWLLNGSEPVLAVLKKVQKFLGPVFNDWLKGYSLQVGQEQALRKSLLKAEVATQAALEAMTIDQLRQLAEKEEVAYFSLGINPAATVDVLLPEATRLVIPSDSLLVALSRIDKQENDLEDPEWLFTGGCLDEYTEFVCSQALQALHGHAFSLVFHESHILSSWQRQPERKAAINKTYELDEIL